MSKVESSLMKKIKENPNSVFKVIVVQNDDSAQNKLEKGGLTRIMDQMHSGSLSGKEIIKLGKLKSVKGVEEDKEMKAL